MSEHQNVYAAHKAKQLELARLLDEASEAIAILNLEKDRSYLHQLNQKVSSDSFKVQVVGTFKNGKSTFINSFLGQEVLPAYATPCTAVINEIRYGTNIKALLYFKSPLPTKLPSSIPANAINHINQYSGTDIPPIEIRYSEIEDYAVIPMDKDPKEMLMESPYEKIELFWPLELLESGVEIIDSPGLNEHATRTQVTMGYLNKADAILFILTADKLCSADEMRFVENNLKKQGFDDVYFIINRFDVLRSDKDKQRTTEFAKMKLSEFTAFGESGLFFVSALNALDGKVQNNVALYESSGMPEFEKELSDFLVNHRGKVKLAQPAKELIRILETKVIKKAIPQLRGMLESSLAEMIARRDEALPRLEKLQTRQEATRQNITRQIDQAIPDIRFHINKFFSDLNTNIPVWIDEFEPLTSVGMIPSKGKIESIIAEISDYIKERVELEQLEWQTDTLAPLIQNKVENIITSNEGNLENFFLELDKIKVTISGVQPPDEGNVPLTERLLAAGAGFFATGLSGATLGGMEGFSKDFVKGIMWQGAAILGLAIIGLLNPLTIAAVIGASFFSSTLKAGGKILKKIKDKVSGTIQDQVCNSGLDSMENMLDGLKNQLWERFEPILNGMDAEIQELETQVNRIIEEMEQGQQETDSQKTLLAACEQKVIHLVAKTTEFISVNIDGR
jgi:GTPase SAR1 family protein